MVSPQSIARKPVSVLEQPAGTSVSLSSGASNIRPTEPPQARLHRQVVVPVDRGCSESMETESRHESKADAIVSATGDDAIARHQDYFSLHPHYITSSQHEVPNTSAITTTATHQNNPGTAVRYAFTIPGHTCVRPRSQSYMMPSLTHSVLSFRARAISFSASDLADRPYKIHDDHGLSAIEEEEAALEHAEELAVLKAGFRSSDISSGDDAACRTGSRSDTSQHLGETFHCDSEQDDGPEAVDLGLDEDENDHCLSGVCLPPSQFFQTSVICSNTMTRDGLANERTFLAWLSACNALCLVSFTFFNRALTLETLAENTQENRDHEHKDHLSRGIGYVCFLSAFFASIYSLLKYLRNIRRISTRYPFAQAGAWTFTVGMFLGMLIMVALVLANTSHI